MPKKRDHFGRFVPQEKKMFLCKECGRVFEDDPSANRIYCSMGCRSKAYSRNRKGKTPVGKKASIIVKCKLCGLPFKTYQHRFDEGRGRFCSRKCYAEWQSETMKGKPTPMLPMIGKDHPNYKGKLRVTCETCGESFEEYPYRSHRRHFCSVECTKKWLGRIPNSESKRHKELKNEALMILKILGYEVTLERWISVNGNNYKIDVYGKKGNGPVLVECGSCPRSKIEQLKNNYERFIHIPYGSNTEELIKTCL